MIGLEANNEVANELTTKGAEKPLYGLEPFPGIRKAITDEGSVYTRYTYQKCITQRSYGTK